MPILDIGDESDDDRPMISVVHDHPGVVVPPHHHETDNLSVIVRGRMSVTGYQHEVGSMRMVGRGTGYGPLVVGPEGCTVIDVFFNRSGMIPVFGPKEGVTAEVHEQRRAHLAEQVRTVVRRRS